MDFGQKLFELRKAKNLSQEEVGEILNVTRQTVSKWETNQSVPEFDKILPLCELFGIGAEELLTGKKPEECDCKQVRKEEEKKLAPTKEERKRSEMMKQINRVVGVFCTVIYLLISFSTMAWHVTWIIFVIDGLICQVIKLLFLLREEKRDEE